MFRNKYKIKKLIIYKNTESLKIMKKLYVFNNVVDNSFSFYKYNVSKLILFNIRASSIHSQYIDYYDKYYHMLR